MADRPANEVRIDPASLRIGAACVLITLLGSVGTGLLWGRPGELADGVPAPPYAREVAPPPPPAEPGEAGPARAAEPADSCVFYLEVPGNSRRALQTYERLLVDRGWSLRPDDDPGSGADDAIRFRAGPRRLSVGVVPRSEAAPTLLRVRVRPCA